jgi:hypothetical protein
LDASTDRAEGTDDADERALFVPLARVRPVAILSVAATVLGRALVPAMRGVVGGDAWLDRLEVLSALASQLMLVTLATLLVAITFSVLRLTRLPLAYRLCATALAGVVLGLAMPASVARLGPTFSTILALAAIAAAILGTAQALIAPHTRAVGVLLGLFAIAALTRQVAWGMAIQGGEKAFLRVAVAARAVATGALVIEGVAVGFAMLWLATRRRKIASIGTSIALFVALLGSWMGERMDLFAASPWKLAFARAVHRLVSPPPPLVGSPLRLFVATLAVALAGAAVASRRETPAIVGTLALVLLAGVDADIPLGALALAVASLSAALAAHDPAAARSATFT